jgi:hypothetical protein
MLNNSQYHQLVVPSPTSSLSPLPIADYPIRTASGMAEDEPHIAPRRYRPSTFLAVYSYSGSGSGSGAMRSRSFQELKLARQRVV